MTRRASSAISDLVISSRRASSAIFLSSLIVERGFFLNPRLPRKSTADRESTTLAPAASSVVVLYSRVRKQTQATTTTRAFCHSRATRALDDCGVTAAFPLGARLVVGALPPLPVCDEAQHLTHPGLGPHRVRLPKLRFWDMQISIIGMQMSLQKDLLIRMQM